jgi:hypothetical protein
VRAFCVTCRTMREVMDIYETDTGDSRDSVHTYTAMPLECGHDANDGGDTPRPRRPIHDRIIKDRLIGLQKGQP